MKIFKSLKSKKGFTLAEMLVSISIFSIVLIAFLTIFLNGFTLTLRAGNKDIAVEGLAGEMEKSLASGSYTSPELSSTMETVIITFPNSLTESVSVEKTVGTATDENGEDISFTTYTTRTSP